jgi:ribonuclease HI
MSSLKATAYIDGSASCSDAKVSSAIIIVLDGSAKPMRYAFSRKRPGLMRYAANVAELYAAKTAIKIAWSQGVTRLTIYHDWNGVAFFADPANIRPRHDGCPVFSQYADFVKSKRRNMRIRFVAVKAHSGDRLNDYADKMAKAGAVV